MFIFSSSILPSFFSFFFKKKNKINLLGGSVDGPGDKGAGGVKVLVEELAAAQELAAGLALDAHNVVQDVVVAVAAEQDLARVQLVQRARQRPHVHPKRVLAPDN